MEAEKINLNYFTITGLANLFEQKTTISKILNVQALIEGLGGSIEYKNMIDDSFCFIKITNKGVFKINIPNDIGVELKRFLMVQGLGHYILHGKSGLNPCEVKNIANTTTSKEAIWFALSILINDELMQKNNQMSHEDLSRLFKVPIFAVTMKKYILNQIKGVD